MNKKTIMLAAFLVMSGAAMAQKADGGISSQMLQQIEAAQGNTPTSAALVNAIASNKIDDLAKSYKSLGQVDNLFSVETPAQSIHNQQSSGRCWMFSGMNVLRANFAKAHNDTLRVEYSQAYLFFYDQ